MATNAETHGDLRTVSEIVWTNCTTYNNVLMVINAIVGASATRTITKSAANIFFSLTSINSLKCSQWASVESVPTQPHDKHSKCCQHFTRRYKRKDEQRKPAQGRRPTCKLIDNPSALHKLKARRRRGAIHRVLVAIADQIGATQRRHAARRVHHQTAGKVECTAQNGVWRATAQPAVGAPQPYQKLNNR